MNGDMNVVVGRLGVAFEEFKTNHGAVVTELQKKLDVERKEREALELRLNRMSLSAALGGTSAADDDLKSVFASIARSGVPGDVKAMMVGSDPAGGYVVAAAQSDGWVEKLWDRSPIRRLATIETITQGDAWEEPIDRDEAEANWVGETAARADGETPDIGKLRIPLHELDASQKLTQKLLDTANRDLGAWISDKITDKFARSEGAAFVSGNGVDRPRGFLAGTPVTTADATRVDGVLQYVKTGNASSFAATNPADKLIDLVYSLRSPYRSEAVWMMNSTVVGTVRKFKDDQKNYIWQDRLDEGQRPLLLGYPVEVNEDMPDLGAGALPVAFGNFRRGYKIVQMPNIRTMQDPFTARPYVKFCAYQRVGGAIADSDAIKLLKCEE